MFIEEDSEISIDLSICCHKWKALLGRRWTRLLDTVGNKTNLEKTDANLEEQEVDLEELKAHLEVGGGSSSEKSCHQCYITKENIEWHVLWCFGEVGGLRRTQIRRCGGRHMWWYLRSTVRVLVGIDCYNSNVCLDSFVKSVHSRNNRGVAWNLLTWVLVATTVAGKGDGRSSLTGKKKKRCWGRSGVVICCRSRPEMC